MHPHPSYWDPPGELDPLANQYFVWLNGLTKSNQVKWPVLLTAKHLGMRVEDGDDAPPRLRFHATDKDVRIGEKVLSYRRMGALLRAIRSGRGFYLEHMGSAGELEVPPPDRFFREVMAPAGYVNRTLSEEGLAALRRRGG